MEDKKLNSGLPGLDKKLDYFRYGENIVYRVKHNFPLPFYRTVFTADGIGKENRSLCYIKSGASF